MHPTVIWTLLGAAGALMVAERNRFTLTPQFRFKGDLKRESRFLSQYGQGSCTVIVAVLMALMDKRRIGSGLEPFMLPLAAVFGTALVAVGIKRLTGRVRPGREWAGRFLGPSLRHDAHRESFPSMHTACAVALTVVLSQLYPSGAIVFWVLAVACGALRYLMDSHWPSDVLAGFALGYGTGWLAWSLMG